MAAVPEKSAPDAPDLVASFSAAPAATPGTSAPDAPEPDLSTTGKYNF